MSDASEPFGEDDIIYRYTRGQAITDGLLVDLTEWARETGLVVPVACTATVWNGYIVPDPALESMGQSVRGRGHDLLWMLYHAIRGMPPNPGSASSRLLFEVVFLMPSGAHEAVRFATVIGPGDDAEPVMTVMLPDED